MILGIILLIAGMIIGTTLLVKTGRDYAYVLPIVIMGIIALCCFNIKLNEPNKNELRYQMVVESQNLYFSDYSMENNNIIIPRHYRFDYSWINSYQYCDSKITIIVPEGQRIAITDNKPTEKPYIVGECK